MTNKTYFGSMGMALSCTLFLEGALKKYQNCAFYIDEDAVKLINEWNKIIICLLKDARYSAVLGNVGEKLIRNVLKSQDFAQKCVEEARDVNVQSLHYALRFEENIRFLNKKIANNEKICLCDLGCGLSPLAVISQNKYKLKDVYCIDVVPEIADLYTNAMYQLNGSIPCFIDWNEAQQLSGEGKINTLVSVGCLPHMPIEQQKEYLKIINKNFDNFFVEIKYKRKEGVVNSEKAFGLEDLRHLCLDVENVSDIETAMIRNSLSYLSKFVRIKPNRRDFLINQSRSLFLSR